MRTLLILPVLLALATAPAAAAAAPVVVNGGGTGTFFGDVDGDGDVEASQFGLGATILGGGEARGHFLCLMAGRSDIFGLALMAVEGQVTGGWTGPGTATLTGTSTVNLGNGTIFRGVGYQVVVTAGGPGTGGLQLTVYAPVFDGLPGDTIPGNGAYDLPFETMTSGQLTIH